MTMWLLAVLAVVSVNLLALGGAREPLNRLRNALAGIQSSDSTAVPAAIDTAWLVVAALVLALLDARALADPVEAAPIAAAAPIPIDVTRFLDGPRNGEPLVLLRGWDFSLALTGSQQNAQIAMAGR